MGQLLCTCTKARASQGGTVSVPGRARASQGGTVINILHLQVLEKFVPKITHENDGLIFNPLEDVRHLLYVHTHCMS